MVTSTLVTLQGTGGGAPAISQSSQLLSTTGRLWQLWTKKHGKIWEIQIGLGVQWLKADMHRKNISDIAG